MKTRPHAIPAMLSVVMLLGALGAHPQTYFDVLRLVVSFSAIFVAAVAFQSKTHEWVTAPFAIMFLIFNPFEPFYFARDTWHPIDVLSAVAFFAAAFVLEDHSNNDDEAVPSSSSPERVAVARVSAQVEWAAVPDVYDLEGTDQKDEFEVWVVELPGRPSVWLSEADFHLMCVTGRAHHDGQLTREEAVQSLSRLTGDDDDIDDVPYLSSNALLDVLTPEYLKQFEAEQL